MKSRLRLLVALSVLSTVQHCTCEPTGASRRDMVVSPMKLRLSGKSVEAKNLTRDHTPPSTKQYFDYTTSTYQNCTVCPPFTLTASPCTQFQDTACKCRREYTYYDKFQHKCKYGIYKGRRFCPHGFKQDLRTPVCRPLCGHHSYWDLGTMSCHRCDPCPIGHGVQRECSPIANTVCEPCVHRRTFSNVTSYEQKCMACTPSDPQCHLRGIHIFCSAYSDYRCGCPPHQQFDILVSRCRRKKKLIPHSDNTTLPVRVLRTGSKYLWHPVNSSTTLSCKAHGIPRPTVTWKLHSSNQPQLNFTLTFGSLGRHLLTPTQWSHANAYTTTSFLRLQLPEDPLKAIITCLAKNGYEHHKGRKKRYFLTTGKIEDIKLKRQPSNRRASVGDNATFTCEVESHKLHDIHWIVRPSEDASREITLSAEQTQHGRFSVQIEKQIIEENLSSAYFNSTLTVSQVNLNDNVNVTCAVVTGKEEEELLSSTAMLTPLDLDLEERSTTEPLHAKSIHRYIIVISLVVVALIPFSCLAFNVLRRVCPRKQMHRLNMESSTEHGPLEWSSKINNFGAVAERLKDYLTSPDDQQTFSDYRGLAKVTKLHNHPELKERLRDTDKKNVRETVDILFKLIREETDYSVLELHTLLTDAGAERGAEYLKDMVERSSDQTKRPSLSVENVNQACKRAKTQIDAPSEYQACMQFLRALDFGNGKSNHLFRNPLSRKEALNKTCLSMQRSSCTLPHAPEAKHLHGPLVCIPLPSQFDDCLEAVPNCDNQPSDGMLNCTRSGPAFCSLGSDSDSSETVTPHLQDQFYSQSNSDVCMVAESSIKLQESDSAQNLLLKDSEYHQNIATLEFPENATRQPVQVTVQAAMFNVNEGSGLLLNAAPHGQRFEKLVTITAWFSPSSAAEKPHIYHSKSNPASEKLDFEDVTEKVSMRTKSLKNGMVAVTFTVQEFCIYAIAFVHIVGAGALVGSLLYQMLHCSAFAGVFFREDETNTSSCKRSGELVVLVSSGKLTELQEAVVKKLEDEGFEDVVSKPNNLTWFYTAPFNHTISQEVYLCDHDVDQTTGTSSSKKLVKQNDLSFGCCIYGANKPVMTRVHLGFHADQTVYHGGISYKHKGGTTIQENTFKITLKELNGQRSDVLPCDGASGNGSSDSGKDTTRLRWRQTHHENISEISTQGEAPPSENNRGNIHTPDDHQLEVARSDITKDSGFGSQPSETGELPFTAVPAWQLPRQYEDILTNSDKKQDLIVAVSQAFIDVHNCMLDLLLPQHKVNLLKAECKGAEQTFREGLFSWCDEVECPRATYLHKTLLKAGAGKGKVQQFFKNMFPAEVETSTTEDVATPSQQQ